MKQGIEQGREKVLYNPNPTVVRPTIIPRGVADSEGHCGYLANAVAGISTLDLTTGEFLWTTDAATQPVFVPESQLAALKRGQRANTLLVVVMDVDRQGEVVLVSEPIVFPDWVVVSTTPDEDFSFEVWGNTCEIRLEWEAHARYRGGAPPSLQMQQQATRDASGVARVNLQTGQVQMLPPKEQAIRQFLEHLGEVATSSLGRGSEWVVTDPWIVGAKMATLVLKDEEEPVLILRTWKLPTLEEETAVEVGRGRGLVPAVTPDGQYLFIYREAFSEGQTNDNTKWQVFSVTTRRLITALTFEQAAQEICVVNSRVLYVAEESSAITDVTRTGMYRCIMKARELTSNKLLWERLLQERRVSGPPRLRQ